MSSQQPVPDLVLAGPASARVVLSGREYINFTGASYLALGHLKELRDAATRAIEQGAAFASQLPPVYGVCDPDIRDLELTVASDCGSEDALYLPSGYFIGAAALTSLDTGDCTLFIDESAHFNLLDAARLAGQPIVAFTHCSPGALERCLREHIGPGRRPLVLTDGVFGTTGRVAPLKEYAAILAPYRGHLVVDEAHSFGVLGDRGRGATEYEGVDAVATTAGTFSKAYCAQGAFIACSREAAEKLRRVPPLRGANAGSPISAAVAAAALRYMRAHPERRARLAELAAGLRQRLRNMGIDVREAPTPIMAFRVGDRPTMQSLHQYLLDRGIYVTLSNYIGAGPAGLIRCAVFADHSEEDFAALAECLTAFRAQLPRDVDWVGA